MYNLSRPTHVFVSREKPKLCVGSILFLCRRENYLIQQIIKENDSLVKAKLKELAQILDAVENMYFYRQITNFNYSSATRDLRSGQCPSS
jgi:hypothetical protein